MSMLVMIPMPLPDQLKNFLDAREHNGVEDLAILDRGLVLQPGTLYLGVKKEYTETHKHVLFLERKSSIGRLGIDIHATAGKEDVGFAILRH